MDFEMINKLEDRRKEVKDFDELVAVSLKKQVEIDRLKANQSRFQDFSLQKQERITGNEVESR